MNRTRKSRCININCWNKCDIKLKREIKWDPSSQCCQSISYKLLQTASEQLTQNCVKAY